MTRRCPECSRVFDAGETFCPFDGTRIVSEISSGEIPADPFIGRLLDGRYRLERVLGQGGVGTVYAATEERTGTELAVKVLRSAQDDGAAFARFEREAMMASKLGEEHIIRIFDFGVANDGTAFLTMELLVGEDLGDFLSRNRTLLVDETAWVISQVCEALGAAHEAAIVHRDLKPENVFLVKQEHDPRPFVKLVDFGLAKMSDLEQRGEPGRKLTKTGMIFGTPQYMAPEQCLGRATDHRADIYAIGVIFYELLVGAPPFDADSFMAVLNQHVCEPPPDPLQLNPRAQVPAALKSLIFRCLEKNPANRPQSMSELAAEAARALSVDGFYEAAAYFQNRREFETPDLDLVTESSSSPIAFDETLLPNATLESLGLKAPKLSDYSLSSGSAPSHDASAQPSPLSSPNTQPLALTRFKDIPSNGPAKQAEASNPSTPSSSNGAIPSNGPQAPQGLRLDEPDYRPDTSLSPVAGITAGLILIIVGALVGYFVLDMLNW